MTPTNLKQKPALARSLWLHLTNTKTVESRPLAFRCSGLPFCHRKFFLDHHFGPLEQNLNYAKEIMTSKGTLIHELVQKWMGRAGILLGWWRCPLHKIRDARGNPFCDHLVGPNFFTRLKTKVCPVHGLELVYEEFAFEVEGLSGHCDGIFSFSQEPPFHLLEIKSISSNLASGNGWDKLEEPHANHIVQSNTYASILTLHGATDFKNPGKKQKIPIEKVLMAYFWTDKPWSEPKTWSYVPDFENLETHLKSIRIIKKSIRKNKLPNRLCMSTNDNYWCSHKDICFSKNIETLLKEKLKNEI